MSLLPPNISHYFDGDRQEHTVGYFFGEAKVHELEVAITVNKDILWLQIAISDALNIVQKFKN